MNLPSPVFHSTRRTAAKVVVLIRKLRREKGWSERRACAAIGISTRSLYRWKNGSVLRRAALDKICSYFKVTGEKLATYELSGPSEFGFALARAGVRDTCVRHKVMGYAVVWLLTELQFRNLSAVASGLNADSAEVLLVDAAGLPCACIRFAVRKRKLCYEALRILPGQKILTAFHGPADAAGFEFCVEYFRYVSLRLKRNQKPLAENVSKALKKHASASAKRTS